MGSPIDENSDRSRADYFAPSTDETKKRIHAHRVLLNDIMRAEGFQRPDHEWWHFSRGDQIWAWLERTKGGKPDAVACYGRADLISSFFFFRP